MDIKFVKTAGARATATFGGKVNTPNRRQNKGGY